MNITKAQKITGLTTAVLVTLFLMAHAVLCLTVLLPDPSFFNSIAQMTATLPIVKVGHVVLDLLILSHIVVSIIFTVKKHKLDPPTDYKKTRTYSKIMMITGIFVLAYLVLHIFNFVQYDYNTIALSDYIRNLYSSASVTFLNVFFIAVLFLHLYIAGRSMIDTFGFPEGLHKRVIVFFNILAVVLFIAYAMVPLCLFFG